MKALLQFLARFNANPPPDPKPFKPPEFYGWEYMAQPTATIGQIWPALLDLNERLSKLEGKE